MDKSRRKIYLTIAIVLTVSIVAIIVTMGFVAKNSKQNPDGWILHAYGNTVALYNDDEIDEVFGDIVLDTLPEDDVRQLENGIAFTTKDEAMQAIEDYDG